MSKFIVVGSGFVPGLPAIAGNEVLLVQVGSITVYEPNGSTQVAIISIDSNFPITYTGAGTVPQDINVAQVGGSTASSTNPVPVTISQVGGIATTMAGSDAVTATNVPLYALGSFNGTTIDRLKADGGVLRVSLQGQGTSVTGSAAVAANNSNSAALPAVSAKTNYITGFSVTTQGGSGAAAGAATITGIITGTLTFEVGAAANAPVQVFVTFPSPIPASAVNTAITVNVPALGANTGAAACTVYGFVQ